MEAGDLQPQRNICGYKCKLLRLKCGYTPSLMVELLKIYDVSISERTLRKIEDGSRRLYDCELLAFSNIFKVTMDELAE